MKHIKNYKEHSVNEEFISKLLSAAKGVFKNFLNSLTAPFKEFKNEFKKEMQKDEVKNKIIKLLDTLFKSTSDNIKNAEDESTILQIKEAFTKELDEKIIEFDNEVKSVKESLILESLKDTLISGRVFLNIVKTKINEISTEYDKKFKEAKDLNAKKQAAIDWIKLIIEDSKKKMTDNKYIDNLIAKYKGDNNVKSEYKVGDSVIYLRKNKTIEEWNAISPELKKDPSKIDIVSVKKISKIEGDNYYFIDKNGNDIIKKSSEIIGKSNNDTKLNNDLKSKLGKIKDDKDKMSKIDKFVDFISKEENKNKFTEIDKIIGNNEI